MLKGMSYLIFEPVFRQTEEEFEDTKGGVRIRKSKEDTQHNNQNKKGQKHKQRSTKHYIVCLGIVYPMLPVSLDCPFLMAPSVFSNVYLYPKLTIVSQVCHTMAMCTI